eukprot:gnl/TRDRNA2_/TRDRNA2_157481_c1_seq3.p1 gnl/TRDRNA2_/TRDRNA2_157481_c1~~gnl/TRDRNA2_/TRDRNA2_157481_c1_seq3.p1  ORF type:complete len:163 (+),score=31.25 gnl/TRDRNA2_/TRDRNA2_157481_c1_seq3:88-576(+)
MPPRLGFSWPGVIMRRLVASCDVVVASSAAEFSAPGSRRGRFCHTPAVALADRLAPAKALELVLLGEVWSAEEAWRHGLVNKLVAPDELAERSRAVAASLSVGVSSAAIMRGKAAFREQLTAGDLPARYRLAEANMAAEMSTRDAVEGTRAMLEKRKPRFEN